MKHVFLFLCLLFLWSKSSTSQQNESRNAIYASVGAMMISQSHGFTPIVEFGPSVDIYYNRFLWKDFGVSFGYAFKRCNPNARTISGDKIACVEQDQSILIAPNYCFRFGRFNLAPYFAMGVCFANFKFTQPDYGGKTNDYKTKIQSCFMVSPGVRVGYDVGKCAFFASYNYDYYRCDIGELPFHVVAIWSFPNSFGHHCLKVGVGFNL